MPRLSVIEADAAELAARDEVLAAGTVFFMYCPFGGERVDRVLAALEPLAAVRRFRVCALDMPLPPRTWLTPLSAVSGGLEVYESTLPGDR
jgi:hypothetical protein